MGKAQGKIDWAGTGVFHVNSRHNTNAGFSNPFSLLTSLTCLACWTADSEDSRQSLLRRLLSDSTTWSRRRCLRCVNRLSVAQILEQSSRLRCTFLKLLKVSASALRVTQKQHQSSSSYISLDVTVYGIKAGDWNAPVISHDLNTWIQLHYKLMCSHLQPTIFVFD